MLFRFCFFLPAKSLFRPLGLVVLSSMLFSISACGPSPYYAEYEHLPSYGWTYADSLAFSFEIRDTAELYTLFLHLEHSPEFPYSNFYVRIHTRYPNGEELMQPVSLELADKTGLWFGRCGRKRCSLSIPLQSKVRFDQKGRYDLVIEQYSRRDTLPGIFALGLSLTINKEE